MTFPRSIPLLAFSLLLAASASAGPERGRILDHKGEVLAQGTRLYPLGADAAHVVGIGNFAAEKPKGMIGIEQSRNEALVRGEDVHTTLDARLQSLCAKHFPDKASGAVVILDAESGAIRALSSFPSFDTTQWLPRILQGDWNKIVQDPAQPLVNRALTPATPASTFKLVTALAGATDPKKSRIHECSGAVQYGNKSLRCWIFNRGKHGSIDQSEALIRSCNCWFFQEANVLGFERIQHSAATLGLGQSPETGLAGESGGTLRPQRPGQPKVPGKAETAILAGGHGSVMASPLQVARIGATFANGKTSPLVHLDPNEKRPAVDLKEAGYDLDAVARIRQAMRDCVSGEAGTARGAKSDKLAIAGRTGTAIIHKDGQQLLRWFVGFAPFDNPRYAICVQIQGLPAQEGQGNPAPGIAKEILEAALELEGGTAKEK